MKTDFKIIPISKENIAHLFELDDAALAKMHATRQKVTHNPGFPCRVSLQDAEIGEEVILFSYDHHAATSAYRSKGPVFVRKNARESHLRVNEIPKMLEHRTLSVRGYNSSGDMEGALTVEGATISEAIKELFSNTEIDYIHVHNAGPGCFNCKVERA
ncbi:DUF1203 domain-containing protein [Aureisphaera galaxeae]|uniref:DUF1203 domain-containing protein n=1 Tax=Aureisphaera galaxeae TaxID=1538023 RepID=UPI0023504F58|nr:DUF1203 domain-containing protein [Aureisphaera galaxeae]MDC8005172.1 DUF1203 domain-containing protein [Aureisphaera galaxeae]